MLEYNICYSLDSKYAEQLAVSMCSILKNSNENEHINFYILDGGLSADDKYNIEKLKSVKDFSIEYINVNQAEFSHCPLNVIKKGDTYEPTHVTLPTYFRIKLPSFLKHLDKILYLDCDVIVRTSLKELFEKDISNVPVLMVLDAENEKESKRLGTDKYFNAGVVVINLDYWRKNNIEQKLLDFISKNSKKILWFDQDVISYVLNGKISEISNKWNYQYFQYEKIEFEEFIDASIVHLAGRFKPWLMSFEHPLYDLYYYYLSFTAWDKNITVYKHMSMKRRLRNGIGGSVTNITVDATDEDIQKVYKEIDNNYKLIDTTRDFLETMINNTHSLVYDEFDKGKRLTEEKIDSVYNEISNNYKYTDSKIDSVYNEISNNYKYTDSKIDSVYNEISNNYKYTEEKIDSVYNEISNNYKYTEEKIDSVYNEISNNYKYTETLTETLKEDFKIRNNEIKEEIDKLWSNFEASKQELYNRIVYEGQLTDEKISKVYDELSNNYKYTDKKITDVYNEISNNYKYTENLIEKVENRFDNIFADLNLKIDGLSSYVNEELSKIYTVSKENYNLLESKIFYNSQENIKRIDNINSKIDDINGVISSKPEMSHISDIEEKISQLKLQYELNSENMQKKFEEELNKQRIKYENRLMQMEELIYSFDNKYEIKTRSIFEKIKNKFKKRKHK